MKDCGSCKYFQKVRNLLGSGGLCDYHDSRADTDGGCNKWKGIKYNRGSVPPVGEVHLVQ